MAATHSVTVAPSPETDAAIVARVRAGDKAAFEAVFHAHYAAMCGYAALYTKSMDVAEEVVQDVLFEFWRRRETVIITQGLRPYLMRAARNRGLNAARRAGRARRMTQDIAADVAAALDAPVTDGTDQRARAAEVDAAIRRAIDRLPPKGRVISELRWYHDLSYAEMAQRLGVTVKAVELQVGRTLKVLRRRLQRLR